jgi:acylphosphatase
VNPASAEGPSVLAREWTVTGRVQGVGFRWFVQKHATGLGLAGWAQNEWDGSVRVYAVGTLAQLNRLALLLREGSRASEVHSVEVREAVVDQDVQQSGSFQTR